MLAWSKAEGTSTAVGEVVLANGGWTMKAPGASPAAPVMALPVA